MSVPAEELNNIEEETDDPRADIEAAFDEVVETEKPAEEEPVVVEELVTEEIVVETADEKEAKGAEQDALPAPGAWTPGAREHWDKLPSEVQQEVARRERERAVEIQRDSEALNYGNTMQQALAPFQSVLAMEGANEAQAVHNLAQTAAGLRMGTPQQKAQIVNNIINAYGVDIETLDSMLAGEPQLAPEQQQMMQQLDQRLAPMQEFMNNVQNTQKNYAQSNDTRMADEVSTFSEGKEFISDVRMEMADLLDMAAARGQEMTLDQAYERAISFHPEIQKVIQGRDVVSQANEEQKGLEAKRKAASSLRSGAGENSDVTASDTLRGALENAWDSGVAGT